MTWMGNLLRKDLLTVGRDRFLSYLVLYPLLTSLALRLLVPWVPVDSLDLLAAPLPVMMPPLFIGLILGFGLIEEKENRTWLLLRVVPLSPGRFFAYLVIVSGAASFVLSLAAAAIYGYPVARWGTFLLMAAVLSLTGPFLTVFLGALAANKIQGMAIAKVSSFAQLAPVVLFVLPPAWQWVAAWSPWYWGYMGLLTAHADPGTISALPGVRFPAYPEPLLWLVPLVLTGGAFLYLARLYRFRAE